ncbi:MAG: hypothetical protein WDM81_06410 [Rhizomicrobium sp.]
MRIGRKRSRQARRIACSAGRFSPALRRDREVHHHDAVLLHDADQEDDADDRDDREVETEQREHQERADAGGGEGRQDGQRVDVALVEHAQDEIDRDERGGDEIGFGGERILEGLRVALERSDHGAGRADLHLSAPDGVRRLAERHAGRQIEGQGDGGKLPVVIDRKERRRDRRPFGKRALSGTCWPVFERM